jgi:hypothetical protein
MQIQEKPPTDKKKTAAPPFLFLSDILAHYGCFEVHSDVGNTDSDQTDAPARKSQISFCSFLGSRLQLAEILLFDVHDLHLISGRELQEVIAFLQSPGNGGKSSIALEDGRDYCLDAETALRAVDSIRRSSSSRPRSTGASAKKLRQ